MKDKEIIEEMKDIVHNLWDKLNQDAITTNDIIDALYNAGYRKTPEDSVVLSSNELKRLETNYKIGLGKSQSWCKSLKNRIEDLEKENFKLKVDNEVLKEEKEQFENDVCNYEMNLQHLTQELENKSKETAEKIFKMLISKLESNQFLSGKRIIMEVDVENLAKQFDVEIEEL